MKLCIAEKPSVAKEIARILGANSRKDGYFEGNGYQVSWTFGHLCTLKTPDDYNDKWKSWRLDSLPMIPQRFGIKLIDNSGVKKQFDTIKKLVDTCEEVINCGDAGIEGELIQRWVLSKANCTKPLKRLWISSLTDEAIKEGFNSLKNGLDYDLLYAAGNARAIGDWLLGMNASRLYTLKFANGKGVLSIGRVQTPTLALIVKRYEEIQNFKPETYWELKTTYRNVLFNSTQGRFNLKEDASKILEIIKVKEFEIISSKKKKAEEHPPLLFDLTSLQIECNKKFSFTADETLKYIQNLYEKKLVTYPRVDTNYLPNDVYPKIKDILEKMKPYSNFTETLLKETIRKSKKVFDDKKITDHHAIIPTGENPSGLILQEKQVYDTIARRFIAAFYPNCIVSNTTVLGQVEEYEFKATGKEILEDGWRVVYNKVDKAQADKAQVDKGEDDKGEENQIMPSFIKGEKGPHTPDLLEKQTQPPKLFTEATLLRAMETAGKQVDDEELRDLMKENGIGRPSTRANIIETLFKRKYVSRSNKNLVPSITGIQLINSIRNELLISVELTGIWEKKLRQIERGEYEAKIFLDEMKQMVSDLVLEVKKENNKTISIEEDIKKEKEVKEDKPKANAGSDEIPLCPKCKKGKILKGKTAYGCAEYKSGCDFKIDFKFLDNELTEKQIFTIINKGKSGKINDFVLNNAKVSGCIELNKNFTPVFIQEKSDKKEKKTKILKCPKCGKGEMLKGNSAYGCSRFREDCNFVIPFDALQEKYNSTELTAAKLKKIIST
ncbi:MAG: DNA topoisomerase 3 [Bacteroidetes bacterium]|nr:DNA topoisomerase 3 [Bacteroidota bacterium]